jgi:hypothetical protein
MTIKLVESVSLGGGAKVSANQDVGVLRARLDELKKNLATIQGEAGLRASTPPQQRVERTPYDICFKSSATPARVLVSRSKVMRPIRNLTPYHVSVYLDRAPVTILPPCFGPSMIETPPVEFRLEAVASIPTAAGQRQMSLNIVPTEAGWDIVVPPGDTQSATN